LVLSTAVIPRALPRSHRRAQYQQPGARVKDLMHHHSRSASHRDAAERLRGLRPQCILVNYDRALARRWTSRPVARRRITSTAC
jgi:hypothetical protein